MAVKTCLDEAKIYYRLRLCDSIFCQQNYFLWKQKRQIRLTGKQQNKRALEYNLLTS